MTRSSNAPRLWVAVALLLLPAVAASESQSQKKANPVPASKLPAASQTDRLQPKAVLDATRRDFGEVFAGEELEHKLSIRNTGNAPLQLVERKTSARNMTPASSRPSFSEPSGRRGAKYKLVPAAARRAAPS